MSKCVVPIVEWLPSTMLATSGMAQVQRARCVALSRMRSMAKKARPEAIAEAKAPACRKAVVQAPREKGSLSCSMIVWQSAAMEGIHRKEGGRAAERLSRKSEGRLPIGRRLTTCPTPGQDSSRVDRTPAEWTGL